MIKINKFEYVYGIKKLNNSNLISQNTIIYSPNGVMKSSLADGLKIISKNENPRDVFNNIDSTYEVLNNGISITKSTNPKHLDLIVFKGEDIFDSVFNNSEMAKIVVSADLKKQYESKIDSISEQIDLIKNAIAVNVLEEKKGTKKSKIDEFLIQYGGSSDFDRINKFLEIKHDDIKENISTVSYSTLYNSKTESILNDSTFKQKAEEYQKLKNVKLNAKIFNNDFSIQELQSMNDAAKKNKYYAAGHKFEINGESLDEKGVDELLSNSILEAYGSDEMKMTFQNAKSILEKNNDSRKVVATLSDNEWLLEKLSNPNKFKDDLIFCKLKDSMEEIMDAKVEIEKIRKEIETIFENANKSEPIWKRVIDTYNQRFYNRHFDISITNQVNAIIGIQQPVFVKKLKNSTTEITEEIFERFSSGEKRAIFILYFLYEIELKKLSGTDFTIVVDDIVDSFDYKNKYAMIEYLNELAKDSQIQLIILTHNFDFYRACKHAFGENLDSQLLAYLDSNDEVAIFDANSNNYESFMLFSDWKQKNNIASLIALIPFLRNLIELKEGNSTPNYATLCDYLHFNLNTANLDLQNLHAIYNDNGVLDSIADSTKYWDLLISEVKSMKIPIKESDIQKKIILGLFIRLASDYLLLNKYRINNSGMNPIIATGSNWTKQLKKLAYKYLSNDEQRVFNRAITVAPSFIHVNSFMYEPLIDVGSEKLLNIAQELILLNSL